jgi:hypothetical protein
VNFLVQRGNEDALEYVAVYQKGSPTPLNRAWMLHHETLLRLLTAKPLTEREIERLINLADANENSDIASYRARALAAANLQEAKKQPDLLKKWLKATSTSSHPTLAKALCE